MAQETSVSNAHRDSVNNVVIEGTVSERVLKARQEIEHLLYAIGDNDPGLRSKKKLLQLCAGLGASTAALLEVGFSPQYIINIDSDADARSGHDANSTLASVKFHVDTVEHFLGSKAMSALNPEYIVGLWSPATVVIDVLEYKLKHPSDTSVGMFTMRQLNEGVDDVARVSDFDNLSIWKTRHDNDMSQQGLHCIIQCLESGPYAATYGVVVYRDKNQNRD